MKVAVIVPCFKRPEYTEICLRALSEAQEYSDVDFFLIDDGSHDSTESLIRASTLPNKRMIFRKENIGLRNTIIEFFKMVQGGYDFLVKMDNDCAVPKNWLNDIMEIFSKCDVDILSPNVIPSDAAYRYGRQVEGLPYLPSRIVGGLWAMRASVINDIYFEKFDVTGITGAFHLLNQIIVEKEPKVGWVNTVTVQDIGHWSGAHPEHIKSPEHQEYSAIVGRSISWG